MPIKILLIDDDKNILEPTKKLLDLNGFECCAKENFNDAELTSREGRRIRC